MDCPGQIVYHLLMIFRRYGTFAGGIDLPPEKHITAASPIEPYQPEQTLRVPLDPCGWKGAAPTVEVGTRVSAGQKIGQALPGGSVDVFAPVGGEVSSITSVRVAARDEFVSSDAIEIVPDSEPFAICPGEQVFDWRAAGRDTLRERIAEGALTTYRRPIEPLSLWIERARTKKCRTLIANVIENQPYVAADHRLLTEHPQEVISGLAILSRAIGAEETILAVDARRTGQYHGTVEPARAHAITRVALPHKYPTGADPILAKVLTRRETPPGGTTMDIGAAVTDAATCFAVNRWVANGARSLGRVVTIAGGRTSHPRNCYVPFGLRCLELLADADQPVIHNGPMIALRCPTDSVVTPATDAVLTLDTTVGPAPTPCIRCSWCTDHCPGRLNVAALNDAFELRLIERASKLIASACVECGVCSYVCPARLPLSQRVRQLKRAIHRLEKSTPLSAKQ